MMKSCEPVIVVDSIEDAVKFYAEKLGFDVVDLLVDKEGGQHLSLARLRKGKCYVKFRIPLPEEFADFTFIKRCSSRCVSICAEMKKGLDKYFVRCQKKGVKVLSEPKDCPEVGMRVFTVKDPFGVKIVFAQPMENIAKPVGEVDICGMVVRQAQAKDPQTIESIVSHLKEFGILRRSAKKFAKLKLKEISKK